MRSRSAALIVLLHLTLWQLNGSANVGNPASKIPVVPVGAAGSFVSTVTPDTHGGAMPAETPIQARVPLTPAQAQEQAQTLLGKRPDRVDSYVSEEEKISYVAFSSETRTVWVEAEKTQKPGYEEVWIYKQVPGSDALRQVWYERNLWPSLNYWSIDGFARISGEKSPALRLRAAWHGATGCGGTRLGLYSIVQNRLFWIDYQQDCGATGMPKLLISEKDAVTDPLILNYLRTWGHEEDENGNLRGRPGEFSKFEQLWNDANGQRPCPADWATSSLSAWKSSRIERPMPYRNRDLYGKPHIVLEDGRFEWLSYFKGPVGVYDTQAQRYSLVYLPNNRYDWSEKLVVIGSWLYIQGCADHWAVRFNKTTHTLERGDFDDVVGSLDTGVYPVTPSGTAAAAVRTENKVATVPSIHPYDLVQNPFAYRGRIVQLDVGSWPYVLNGQVYRWVPMVDVTWAGIQFRRMLTENEALYDVRGLDLRDAASGLTTLGQLIVLVPNASSRPHPGRIWLVRPLGVETGTNYFGAGIQVPKLQFLKYADE